MVYYKSEKKRNISNKVVPIKQWYQELRSNIFKKVFYDEFVNTEGQNSIFISRHVL